MCKRCKRPLVETSKGQTYFQNLDGSAVDYNMGFLVDGMCPACYMQERVRPIDKEMNQCEATLASLRAARFHAFKKLEDAKQEFIKVTRTATKLATELPWWCKCGQGFKHEPEYISHAYSCQGKLPVSTKERTEHESRAQRVRKMQEIEV